jgi:alkylhydroperoxidase family enzyme
MTRIFKISGAALVILAVSVGVAPAQEGSPSGRRFPISDNAEAWKLLPRETPPLPEWARVLAPSLPKTTAAMLELDYVHRVKNPLGPVLAGKIRWAAADEIGCEYARKYAEADLRRAGLKDDDLKEMAGDRKGLTENDRLALDFARKLTRAGHEITDSEVAELIKRFGPEAVVGIVHTVAHSNFQNRIFLALNVQVEASGPLPPLDLRLDAEKRSEIPVPARPSWEELLKAGTPAKSVARPDWGERSFDEIEKALDGQKNRGLRIPLPDAERLAAIPAEAKEQASKVVWTKVSMGYQPVLTKAWFDCMNTFRDESKLDRVFSNSVFWVITRTNDCFY